ncbi:hypothetical protein [Brachyspira pulli]|uniref:hypothetical protein n=1 Tax=Brachyspira pulli TaxID=310721 RepID=UPI0030054D4A
MYKNIKDEIEKYLPKYLSPETEASLFENLKDFPKKFNIYSNIKSNFLMQGDGIVYNNKKILLISNTCDMDSTNNKRFISMSILYAQICSLDKTEKILKKNNYDSSRINNFISSIKSHKVTNIFYLPKNEVLQEDSFIMFDKINNMPNNISQSELLENKLFTLNQTGFYLFLLKLSIHFTRMCEKIDRDNPNYIN